MHAEKLRRIAELCQRQAWMGSTSNPARMLVDRLGVTPGEARGLIAAAEVVQRMPKVAARLAAGEISAAHVAELARTVSQLQQLHARGAGSGQGEAEGSHGAGSPATADGTDAGDGAEAGGASAGARDPRDGEPDDGPGGSSGNEAAGTADRFEDAVAALDDLVGGLGDDDAGDGRDTDCGHDTAGDGRNTDGGDHDAGDGRDTDGRHDTAGDGRNTDGGHDTAAAGEPESGEPGGHGSGEAGDHRDQEADRADGGTEGCTPDGAGVCDGAAPGEATGRGPVDRRQLRRLVRDWEHARAPELLAERERRQRARRGLWVGPRHGDPDGMGGITGDLDAVTTAKAQQVIHALARKTSKDDTRTFRQRCHDAFAWLLDQAIRTGHLPDVAGDPPRVLLILEPGALHGQPGAAPALLDGYGPISSATARQMCCDAEVTVVAKGDGGSILNVGRDRRQPNRAQRRGVFARDAGCVGCGATLSRCQIHHIHWWGRGGPTDIDNLVAVCWDCHANIHHHGWQVIRRPGGRFGMRPPDRPHPPHPPAGQTRRGQSRNGHDAHPCDAGCWSPTADASGVRAGTPPEKPPAPPSAPRIRADARPTLEDARRPPDRDDRDERGRRRPPRAASARKASEWTGRASNTADANDGRAPPRVPP